MTKVETKGNITVSLPGLKWIAEDTQRKFGNGTLTEYAADRGEKGYSITLGGSFSDVKMFRDENEKLMLEYDKDERWNKSLPVIKNQLEPHLERLKIVAATIEEASVDGMVLQEVSEVDVDTVTMAVMAA